MPRCSGYFGLPLHNYPPGLGLADNGKDQDALGAATSASSPIDHLFFTGTLFAKSTNVKVSSPRVGMVVARSEWLCVRGARLGVRAAQT